MRNLLKLGFVSCLAISTLFTACSKDDDETKPEDQQPGEKFISQIIHTNFSKEKTIYNFDKDGKLISQEEGTTKTTYQYSDDEITVNNGTDKSVYKLDNGRITEYVYGNNGSNIKYNYSPDDYLSLVSHTDVKSECVKTRYINILNDNIESLEVYEEDYKNSYYYQDYYTFEYKTIAPNNLKVDLVMMLAFGGIPMNGYCGKKYTNLPYKINYTGEMGKLDPKVKQLEQNPHTIEYEYTYDGDFIVNIEEFKDGYRNGTYEITYK